MRKLALALLLLLMAVGANAQTTTVTGTVVDPNTNPYANGTVSAFLILATGQPLPPGTRQSSGPFPLNSSGFFSISLASPQTYTFTVCGTPVNIGPRGNPTPNSVCFPSPPIVVSGASQDITATLNAAAAVLGPSLASSGSGCIPGVPVGSLQKNSGGGCVASAVTEANGKLSINENVGFAGPNPYVDVTVISGVRAIPASGAPATPGITGSCTSGSPVLNISIPSSFQNGDGIVAYGCGPGTIVAPAAPTVAACLAAGQTGLLLDVCPAPVGATQYCYQAVDSTPLHATNVSVETCIANGPASLGLQTNSVTSCTLILEVMNCLTSAPHGLIPGAQIVVTGTAVNLINGQANGFSSINPFSGWFRVDTVPDNTHFTVNLWSSARNGAVASATGGTLNYWNTIHITMPETANNYQYSIYGRVTGGTKTLIGLMWPQDVNLIVANFPDRFSDVTYLAFDDFGSTVTTLPNKPFYLPTTVPTVGTNDMLVSTIVSGAGTTSLTLASNAGNTNSGQTVLFDDAVTFLTAANSLPPSGISALMLPETGTNASNTAYVFNSPITLPQGTVVRQKGLVRINEPIAMSSVSWYGETSGTSAVTAFANLVAPNIQLNTCSPCFFVKSASFFHNLRWSMLSGNGAVGFMQESGGIPSAGLFRDVQISTGTGANTYSNMGMVFRGNGAGFEFSDNSLVGTQNGSLTGTTPGIYFDLTGNASFKNLSLAGIGLATRVNAAGGTLKFDNLYCQGCYTPFVGVAAAPTDALATSFNSFDTVVFDTTLLPLIADYGGHPLILELVNSLISANDPYVTGSGAVGSTLPRVAAKLSGVTGGGPPINMGSSYLNSSAGVSDGTFGRGFVPVDIINKNQAVGPGFSLYTTTSPPAPMTGCVVSAGGSVPIGTNFYFYAPIYPNGSEGTISIYCLATTSGGNQTVTLDWTAIPTVTQYNVYRGLNQTNVVLLNNSPITGTHLVDTLAFGNGASPTTAPAGGPAGVHAGLVWGQTLQLGVIGFASLGTPPNGTFTFCPDCTIANPCAGAGTGALAKRLNGVWVCN